MLSYRRLAVLSAVCCLPLLALAGALVAADRPARVVTPEGSPIWLDPQRTLLFDSPAVAVMRRNEHTGAVNYALRIWAVDEGQRVKGTLDYCTYDQIGRDIRGSVLVPLEIPGVTLRDRAVVTVSSAISGPVAWRLRESEREQLDAVLASARGAPGRLSFQRETAAPDSWSCSCDCAALGSACDQRCGTGGATATCTRTLDGGCSAVCACK